MKIFYNTGFEGFYPVGTSAIVVAPNKKVAASLLEKELSEMGLTQQILPDSMIEVSSDHKHAIILQDGEY